MLNSLFVNVARVHPWGWLLFGIFGFPGVCFASEILGWLAMAKLELAPKSIPSFGWGGAPGLFLGLPLGAVSAACAYFWQIGRHNGARVLAVAGGVAIGGLWLSWMIQLAPIAWLGDFGFAVTPLIWAGTLVLFGFLVRSRRSEDRWDEIGRAAK